MSSEEITRRHAHSHAGFEARGHHLSEHLTCSSIVNPTSTVPGSQRSCERGAVDLLKRVGARQSSKCGELKYATSQFNKYGGVFFMWVAVNAWTTKTNYLWT